MMTKLVRTTTVHDTGSTQPEAHISERGSVISYVNNDNRGRTVGCTIKRKAPPPDLFTDMPHPPSAPMSVCPLSLLTRF